MNTENTDINKDTLNLDEMLECAIREKGLMARMKTLDRKEKLLRKRRRVWTGTFGGFAMAAVAVLLCLDSAYTESVKKLGFNTDPASMMGMRGETEITALIKEDSLDKARQCIDAALVEVEEEIAAPASADSEYLRQLKLDKEELEFQNAICLMRQGKYFQAEAALENIASSGGAFEGEARKLLEEM